MTRAYIVTLQQDESSPDSDAGTAELIKESLEHDGLPVVFVAPWATPDSAAMSGMSSAPSVQTPPPVKPLW